MHVDNTYMMKKTLVKNVSGDDVIMLKINLIKKVFHCRRTRLHEPIEDTNVRLTRKAANISMTELHC